MRLKSHESPRKGGRNTKGRGGAARQRQLKKRSRLLVNKLKAQEKQESLNPNSHPQKERHEKAPIAIMLGGFLDLSFLDLRIIAVA